MNARSGLVWLGFLLAVSLPFALMAQSGDLKQEPGKGELAHGKVVYVDDGSCPKGEIKMVTGGSQNKSVPRSVRCVPRPQ